VADSYPEPLGAASTFKHNLRSILPDKTLRSANPDFSFLSMIEAWAWVLLRLSVLGLDVVFEHCSPCEDHE